MKVSSWVDALILGFARIFDFLGVLNTSSDYDVPDDEEARKLDYLAIKADWEAVGRDIWMVMKE